MTDDSMESERDAGVLHAWAAAKHLIMEPDDPVAHEPSGADECFAAVVGLTEAFRDAGKTFEEVIDNSRAGAESLSTDTFQGLSEIVQNANDVAASTVSFRLDGTALEVRHNGRRVNLRDLRAIAVPWLTTKSDDPIAAGKFGVGLSTLHRFAETFEVHSGDYHVRVGDPFIENLDSAPGKSAYVEDTILRVVFREGAATEADFVRWYELWDDSALMFLAHVRKVGFSTPTEARTLSLDLESTSHVVRDLATGRAVGGTAEASGGTRPVTFSVLRAPDGRTWLRSSCEVPSPVGVHRARKKKGATTPLGVALPLFRRTSEDGVLYSGLPVAGLPGVAALVNAQFDPFTTRQGLLASDWNFALAAAVDGLWLVTIEYLFSTQPRKAWRCVPLGRPGADSGTLDRAGGLIGSFIRLVHERCDDLGARLGFDVDGTEVPLNQLAVEAATITDLLSDDEVATLAGLPHRLPDEVRDRRGQWRRVLTSWRRSHTSLPAEITIEDAVGLLDDPTDRSIENVIGLTSVALDLGLAFRLDGLACLLDDRGNCHRPPDPATPYVLMRSRTGLASALGIGIPLHPAYLTDHSTANTVFNWLLSTRRFIEADDLPVLERLASAGRAGNPIEAPMSDEQLRSIRLAMEPLGATEWARLGRDIGKAVFLAAYRYGPSGDQVETHARPCDCYQPKRIDSIRDSFATAAGATPGLTWVANRYQEVLRSSVGRGGGLGAQRFLRALGCSAAPRLTPHPRNRHRFTNPRQGLDRWFPGSPAERGRAMLDLEADFTLDDTDSPDLAAVLTDIAAEVNGRKRRERGVAILNTLGRAWRDLGESAEVDAALAYQYWQIRGPVHAFWLWRAGSIPWMDNALGEATTPGSLRRSSPSTRALFGNDPSGLVHSDFAEVRTEILNALGVSGEPRTPELIGRLIELRDGQQTDETLAQCGVVYQAIASRLEEGRASIGLTDRQLREQLAQRGGLIRTTTRWAPPTELRRGKPIFGTRRDFTPSIPRTERLWDALQIQRPGIDDCIKVIWEIAKTAAAPSPDDEAIMIETLRALDDLLRGRHVALGRGIRDKLRLLPLWTSSGWRTKRPIYTTQDPQLVDGIGTALPVWAPGVDTTQFHRLFAHLRVTPIDPTQVRVQQADLAAVDDDATRTFQDALDHFKDDLTRNDPSVESTLRVAWAEVATYEVRSHPRLQAVVTIDDNHALTIPIWAIVDPDRAIIFIRDPEELERVDGVGRALAALFAGDARAVSHAWLAAVQADREGLAARAVVLAAEQQARQETDAATRMSRLNEISSEAASVAATAAAKKGAATRLTKNMGPRSGATSTPAPEPARKPRYLVDPTLLVVTNTGGTIVNGTGAVPKKPKSTTTNKGRGLLEMGVGNPQVDPLRDPPKRSTSYRVYTEEDKERLGLEIASRVLKGDEHALVDIRNQRGVGADAIDDLRRFYELKVHAGEEPGTIALEPSQIRLAMSEPNFFLVIVSNLEGQNARPQVRVIHDPLAQLSMNKSSRVTFSGVQETTGLVFRLGPSEQDTEA